MAITSTVITPPISHLFRFILLDMFIIILLLLPMLSSTPFNCNKGEWMSKLYTFYSYEWLVPMLHGSFTEKKGQVAINIWIKEQGDYASLYVSSLYKEEAFSWDWHPEHERNSQREVPCYQHAWETVAADADHGEVKLRALLFPASSSDYPWSCYLNCSTFQLTLIIDPFDLQIPIAINVTRCNQRV